ncbi:MAG: hypothetical protein V4494_07815 [Chlamydiota bacterium]
MKFAIVKSAAPLLNTQEFSAVFKHPLSLDNQGLLRAVETIALPCTLLTLVKQCSAHIYQVTAPDYSKVPLFTDGRFLTFVKDSPQQIKKTCPPYEDLLQRLKDLIGVPYIWGGNWDRGIPELLEFYPPEHSLDSISKINWALKGVDCSGLLYQVTDGFTPRNTFELLHFGNPIPIEGLSVEAIAQSLLPLDLIVWRGHIVIVLDTNTSIESACPKGGVVTENLHKRLSEILKTKSAHNTWKDNTSFVIRRFINT